MVKACVAFGCRNNASSGRSFHSFPKHPGTRRKWIRALRRKDYTPGSHAVICSDHFLSEDYVENPDFVIRKLKHFAVPSQFPTSASYPGGRKRRLSDGIEVDTTILEEEDDLLSKVVIIPLGHDPIASIQRDHSYAFPSSLTLAKMKCDSLQSLLEKKNLNEEKLRNRIRQLKFKNKVRQEIQQVKFKSKIRKEFLQVKFKSRKGRSQIKRSF